MSDTYKGDILIVDDTPANLTLLGGILRGQGYKVRPVTSGKMALEAAESQPPDIILLDVTMPGLDGYEVCARLKTDPRLASIPVLFISALTDPLDKVKAFEAGGLDYVTKPFSGQEVCARVHTHLTLRRLQLDLLRKYDELRDLQAMRDSLTHMIVHDLRAPLTGISGYLQLLKLGANRFSEKDNLHVNNALASTGRMVEMISSLLDVNRLESGEMPLEKKECDLSQLASEATSSLGGLTLNRNVTIESGGQVLARCDPEIIRRVVANLVGNALKFTPASGAVTVGVLYRDGVPRIEVRDTGCGISAEYLGKVFDKFTQVEARKEHKMYSTGLGLTFCKLAVEAHGGAIAVDSVVGEGSRFHFELPTL